MFIGGNIDEIYPTGGAPVSDKLVTEMGIKIQNGI